MLFYFLRASLQIYGVLLYVFSRQSNSLIYGKKLLPENYWAVFYDIWTVDRGNIGA